MMEDLAPIVVETHPPVLATRESLRQFENSLKKISESAAISVVDRPMNSSSLSSRDWLAELFQSGLWNEELARRLIPHLKTRDYTPEGIDRVLKTWSKEYGISKVLMISGDGYQSGKDFGSLEALFSIPDDLKYSLKIFTALDPYANDMGEEWSRAEKKIELGSAGFFTQPIWNIDYAQVFTSAIAKKMPGVLCRPGVLIPSRAMKWPRFWEEELRRVPGLAGASDALATELVQFYKAHKIPYWTAG